MKQKSTNITKTISKYFPTNIKGVYRFLLISPLILYAGSVFFYLAIQNNTIEKIAHDDIAHLQQTETQLDATISSYDASSSIFGTSSNKEDSLIMTQLFSGQGGYDTFKPEGFVLPVNTVYTPRSLIQDLHTEKEYPNLTYSTYRIQEGDMIGVIAERFGITQDTLISINNIRQTRNIQIGEYLKIPSMPGILYTVREAGETPKTIATKYEVSAEKTASVNGFAQDVSLSEGTLLFVPDALLDWVTIQEINGDLFKIPIRGRYWVSSSYGWRTSPFSGARSYHAAIDMAAPKWTRIYAALQGQVTQVRYGDPVYGNYVVITHHSGYTSLYAHMEDVNVSRWEYVDTSSIIGWVGSTGMSTGDHLHFAVLKYGTSVNPASLWN